jgi:putative tryptophan/tyrosine transport system substrate-binding protein
VATPQEIEQALRSAREKGSAGVNVLSSALLFALRTRIVSLAAELDLPAIYQWPETIEEGGLIAYGPSLLGAFDRGWWVRWTAVNQQAWPHSQ